MRNKRLLKAFFLTTGPLSFLLLITVHPDDPAYKTLGIVLWMGLWWMSRVVPLAITALLPLVLAPATGIVQASELSLQYARSPIFLFLGGFLLAIALEKNRVPHKALSLLMDKISGSTLTLAVALNLVTYFFSMWISNTATVLIVLPVLLSLPRYRWRDYLAISVAYSSTLGGITTLVGTPPNAFLAGVLEASGIQITFGEWLLVALPASMAVELLLLAFIVWVIKSEPTHYVTFKVQREQASSRNFRITLSVFVLTVLLWVFRKELNLGIISIPGWQDLLGISGINDATVAVTSAVLLAVLGQLKVEDWKRVPWDALIVFGGGFAISHIIRRSGLGGLIAEFISTGNEVLNTTLWSIITLSMTEIASNTATSAVFVPLALEVGGKELAVIVTLAASGAFMLPVATMPNLIVYSSGLISFRQMLRLGIVMNMVYLLAILTAGYGLAGAIL